MPNSEAFKSRNPTYSILLNGQPGAGKTRSAMTFPKVFVIGCDPSGLDILYQKGNESLLNNLCWYEYLHNESEEDLKKVFNERAGKDDLSSVYGCLALAKDMAQKGEIKTLLLDGFNYLVDMRWQWVNEYSKRTSSSGNLDSQAMYRDLGLYLNRFFSSDLLTMGTRLNLNVVITCHLRRESPLMVEGTKDRAGKVNQDSDISPAVEGGFRQKIEGLVGASIYLEHKQVTNKEGSKVLIYKAHTQKSSGLNTILLAKNRYALPNPLDLTNKSLYDVLVSCQSETIKGIPQSEKVVGSVGSK